MSAVSSGKSDRIRSGNLGRLERPAWLMWTTDEGALLVGRWVRRRPDEHWASRNAERGRARVHRKSVPNRDSARVAPAGAQDRGARELAEVVAQQPVKAVRVRESIARTDG